MPAEHRPREARWIAAVVGGMALGLLLAAGPVLDLGSRGSACETRLRTGRPCLGCGGTRALGLVVRGELIAAFAANPLGAFGGAALMSVVLASGFSLAEGRLRVLRLVSLILGALAPAVAVGWFVAWWRLATAAHGMW